MIDDAESADELMATDDGMKHKVGDDNDDPKDLITGKIQKTDGVNSAHSVNGSRQNKDGLRNNRQTKCSCCILWHNCVFELYAKCILYTTSCVSVSVCAFDGCCIYNISQKF